ncbi:PREDICTED: uncharacterized protein LOC109126186 [Camelina sativa]|uniref:Uncharacterized protein LOC109126186 n=1 Tax=Camelina sativa TaxID=90675 RepID=A0ABM1QDU7_CAMSA|nr:PREDICTED: uncharacterized protein LOC109126186 [Camelina sativa]
MQIYVICGVWTLGANKEWRFIDDEEKRARLLTLQPTTSLEELQVMVSEDYEIEQSMFDVEFSYLPTKVKVDYPPVVLTNDRGMKIFLACLKRKNMIRLCVTFKGIVDDDRSKVQFDLNKDPHDTSDGDDVGVDLGKSVAIISRNSHKLTDVVLEKPIDANLGDAAGSKLEDSMVKKGEYFSSKEALQATMEMYGCELKYHQAWESREYAVNEVRGIPEKSYAKIPKYLHMLQEANSGTFTNYEIEFDGRFKYLFTSFGQSRSGFYKAMRKVIVVDGIFLKNKYKGVLLVATAFKMVIADEEGLSFVSDRHTSIAKSIGNIYPLAKHGICIHHLISNAITYNKGRGVAGMVVKASKASEAYIVSEFEKEFVRINNINPAIGSYLEEADVRKWARISTNNAAESINAALRSPREYPIIPLLDSIREMMTRWFYESRELSAKQKDSLTVEVEKKISRRIEKGKFMNDYPMSRSMLQVKGNGVDNIVDLERRTCSCGKFSIGKLPCRHAIKRAFDIGKDLYPCADDVYTTTAWRSQYE